MRDQLDDAAGGVVEVGRASVPEVEVENVAEQLHALSSPAERRIEAVAGDEEREVVEGASLLDAKPKPRLPDLVTLCYKVVLG